MIKKENQQGYVIIISVLIVGTVGLVITVVLALLSNDFYRTSFSLEQSNQSKALSNSCVETALQVVRNDNYYFGTDTVSLGQGTCDYLVIDTGGETREIQSTGTVGNIVRKVRVTVSEINPEILINSWQEVADF